MNVVEYEFVWLVESGEFADYTIIGVYSTKKKANICMKRYNNRKYKPYKKARARVCERILNPIWDEDRMYPET